MSGSIAPARAGSAAVPALVLLAAAMLVLGGLFWQEAAAAVGVWIASTAYGHCFLVIPIAGYLAWDRREALRGLLPRASPRLALLAMPLPFAWLAAERLGIMEGRQLIALGFAEVLILSVLGWRLFHALLAPLLYLVFLVPFGAFVTPWLQSFTAGFIDVGLTVLGIPHFVSDMQIEVPQGLFYVAEACAGLRFLIAMVAFGVFFAVLNYAGTGKRLAFIAASIVVPIVANGFRALGIVVLGTILGSAEAAAADHLIYGWVFFSIVMLLLVLAGLPFRDPPAGAPAPGPSGAHGGSPVLCALLLLPLAALGPAIAFGLDARVAPARLVAAPRLQVPGGCGLESGPVAGDRAGAVLTCGGRVWAVTMQAVPGGATARVLNDVRSKLHASSGDEDEAVTGALPGRPGWQVTTQRSPAQVVGVAAWIDGQPAAGGLRQRLGLARASVLGAGHDSLVMAVDLRPASPLSPSEMSAAVAELARFVGAQPDLSAEVARVTESNSPRQSR